jgi:hypothetical protein
VPTTLALFVLVALCVCGCAAPRSDFDEDLPVTDDFDRTVWHDAVRISNGTANLIIVPSIGGRIMRYGLIGEPNVLWTNPNAKPRPADDPPATKLTWTNYGGEKVWIWPQEQWPRRMGRAWPPQIELDQVVMRSRLLGSLHVRLESQPVRGYGVRVVRDITLAPQGSRVTMITRLEPAGDEAVADDLAAWSIAQLPAGKLYARLRGERAIRGLEPSPWAGTRAVADGVVEVQSPPQGDGKMGLDADTFAWANANLLFVQHNVTAMQYPQEYKPAERAQFYAADPKRIAAAKLTPYVETEFTSPRRDGQRGELPELRVVWELHPAEKAWTDQSVVEFLKK